jgi:DUF1707 SHOCT-like domain
MPAQYSPPKAGGAFAGNGASYTDPHLRISDAERAAVADRLSRHYSDGRLDQAEFDERLERAMNAKTHADLHGLFADLPDDGQGLPPGSQLPPSGGWTRPGRPPSARRTDRGRTVLLILLAVISVIAIQHLVHPLIPLLWIGLIIFLIIRYLPARRRRWR